MGKHRRWPVLLPEETSEQLSARLWRFALATRDDATRASGTTTTPFPEQVSVLAAQAGRTAGDPDRDDDGGQ